MKAPSFSSLRAWHRDATFIEIVDERGRTYDLHNDFSFSSVTWDWSDLGLALVLRFCPERRGGQSIILSFTRVEDVHFNWHEPFPNGERTLDEIAYYGYGEDLLPMVQVSASFGEFHFRPGEVRLELLSI